MLLPVLKRTTVLLSPGRLQQVFSELLPLGALGREIFSHQQYARIFHR
jgi:hypothetical protein